MPLIYVAGSVSRSRILLDFGFSKNASAAASILTIFLPSHFIIGSISKAAAVNLKTASAAKLPIKFTKTQQDKLFSNNPKLYLS